MENPTVKLIFDGGPRQGETLECRAASKTRIGRVIRGNTFSIKDPGISQKHLLIEFNSINWIVSDLDSSNGTFLNGDQIQAMTPFNLTDGDTIKIGETTSILVKIEPKREVVAAQVDLPENAVRRVLPRRAASRRAAPKEESIVVPEVSETSQVSKLRTEGCKDEAVRVDAVAEASTNAVGTSAPARRGRGRGRPRTRAAPKKDPVLVSDVREILDCCNLGSDRGKEPDKIALDDKNNLVDCVNGASNDDTTSAFRPDEAGKFSVNGASNRDTTNTFIPHEAEKCSISDVTGVNGASDTIGGTKDVPDLEKMTLGEWFERMEKYLPQKIDDVAAEIIRELKKRQNQFENYVTKQCSDK